MYQIPRLFHEMYIYLNYANFWRLQLISKRNSLLGKYGAISQISNFGVNQNPSPAKCPCVWLGFVCLIEL